MKTTLMLCTSCFFSSCGLQFEPVSITYTDQARGISVTEKVGDGKFSPSIDITEIVVSDNLTVHKQTDGSILIDHNSAK